MASAFVLAPPPQMPRRRVSRPSLKVAEYPSQSQITFVQPASQVSVHKLPAEVYPMAPSQASTSTLAVNQDGGRSNRASGKSFKRHFKSPFSKSAPSSPERPTVPALPAHLAENVAAIKAKAEPAKPAKKSKSKAPEEKKADKKIHTHANSKNQRPITYGTAVQLNMLMGGGSEDYWVSHARPTAENEDEVVEEVGGFKDEDGRIWWDVEEKAEWTSLLPKDSQGVQATSNDMWVEFNNDYRRNSASSGDSTLSFLSTELAEEVDGPVLYVDAEMEQSRSVFGMHKATAGTVLFPIDLNEEPHSPEATEARAIISQAHGNWTSKSAVLIDDGFEDSFLSYESEIAGVNRRPIVAKEATVTMSKPAKKGILKGLWGSKHAARD